MSTRNQAAWCIGSNTTPPLEWGDERRGACPDCGRWVGMIGPSGAVPRMSKHLPSPRSEEVKQLRAERDRYRQALASIEPVWLSADEPRACPIHRESQLYDAVVTVQHACEYTEAVERAICGDPT